MKRRQATGPYKTFNTRYYYKQHFYRKCQAEIGKNQAKANQNLRLNFWYLKIIIFPCPCYHPRIVGDILKMYEKKVVRLFNGNEKEDENEKEITQTRHKQTKQQCSIK